MNTASARQALTAHVAAGNNDELVASWVSLRQRMEHCSFNDGTVFRTAMGAIKAELLRRGMSPEQFDNLDWAIAMASETRS